MSAPTLLERLRRRALIAQCSDPAVASALEAGQLTFYIGIDPTSPSLHVGHLIPLMLLYWLAKLGNRPIIVIGEATARIGDPSGREEARELLGEEQIAANAQRIRQQLQQLNKRQGITATLVSNTEWLSDLRYLDFLRHIGYHFSVNRMLSFESYRRRLERGLSFIEFNYQLLQSYDFLQLHQRYGCQLQIGGDDQWGNIVSGIDLIRRISRQESYGITTPLVTNAQGQKMGKTLSGAIFLDSEYTSPYDFFQFWRNIDDRDLSQALLRYTMLDEQQLQTPPDATASAINLLKERLAFEVTSMVHGAAVAQECRASARRRFGTDGDGGELAPDATLSQAQLEKGIAALDLFLACPFLQSRSEVRRLIDQGGASINGQPIDDPTTIIGSEALVEGRLLLQVGKKRHWSLAVE